MNMQCSLIWELILHKFKIGHNAAEAIKNNSCVKGKRAVNHSTVTRWFKKFCSGCKKIDHQARSS